MNEATKTAEEPSEGGSYIRHEDGRLERVAFTAALPSRDKRAAGEPDTTQPESSSGAAMSAAPVVQLGSGTQE